MTEIGIVKGKAEHTDGVCIGSKWNIDITIGCACRGIGGECQYPCYAHHINYGRKGGRDEVKTLNEKRFINQIRREGVEIIRYGKFTDCGIEWAVPTLKRMLIINKAMGVRPIVVTKLLKFDEEIARLIRDADGIIHYSLGDDELEPGARTVLNNSQRIIECLKYRRVGTNAIVRIVLDSTLPPSSDSLFSIAKGSDIPILVTPIRCKSRKELEKWTEIPVGDTENRYAFSRGFYRPKTIHEFYEDEMICGETSDGQIYCGKCGLRKRQ